MRKMIAAAVTAALAVSMVSTAFADDVSVRTSIGSGEVVFTETSEAADISSEELTELVKDGIRTLNQNETLSAFLDAEASVSLKVDEENELNLSASAIGSFDKNGTDQYGSFTYFLEGIGEPQSAKYETYHWVKDDTHYTAQSDGSGWIVKSHDPITEVFEQLEAAMDTEQVSQISVEGLLPNLYEENGEKYYICLYDRDSLMSTFSSVKGAELYAAMAEGFLGDNGLKFIAVVNAETGLLRAISLDASGAQGQIPGSLLGAEGSLGYSADDLYVTFLLNDEPQTVEIPEEVLNTPVTEEEESDLNLESLLSGLGVE